MRKLTLTGALVVFGAGSAPQIVFALAVCILWLNLVRYGYRFLFVDECSFNIEKLPYYGWAEKGKPLLIERF